MHGSKLRGLLLLLLGLCALSVGWSMFRRGVQGPLPRLTIEVLNGSGVDRLGARWAEGLRALGQDVVRVEDAPAGTHPRSMLIDRRGRVRLSRRLGLELGELPLVLEAKEGADVDLTLLLGADHARFGPPRGQVE